MATRSGIQLLANAVRIAELAVDPTTEGQRKHFLNLVKRRIVMLDILTFEELLSAARCWLEVKEGVDIDWRLNQEEDNIE